MALFFYQFTPLYGHNQDFGSLDPSFTDKRSKKPALSVNPHHNGQKFTDKSLGNAGLSVKFVLITDKSAQNGTLSVNLNEILAESLSSTAFRSTGQNQSQIDRFRSAFRLTQERKEKFSPVLDRPYQAL